MGTVLNVGNMHILCRSLSRKSSAVTPIFANLREWCETSMLISTFWWLCVHFVRNLHKITKSYYENWNFAVWPKLQILWNTALKNVSNLSIWNVNAHFWWLCVILFGYLHKIIKFPLVSLITGRIEISLYDQNYGFCRIPRKKCLKFIDVGCSFQFLTPLCYCFWKFV